MAWRGEPTKTGDGIVYLNHVGKTMPFARTHHPPGKTAFVGWWYKLTIPSHSW
jgi:hypothetical protein